MSEEKVKVEEQVLSLVRDISSVEDRMSLMLDVEVFELNSEEERATIAFRQAKGFLSTSRELLRAVYEILNYGEHYKSTVLKQWTAQDILQ